MMFDYNDDDEVIEKDIKPIPLWVKLVVIGVLAGLLIAWLAN